MLTEIRKEMSNFLTKEEAELILNRRNAMIDPAPYRMDGEISKLHMEVDQLRQEVYFLRTMLNKQIYKQLEVDEPTI
jgi:hypothetical protein